MNFKAVIACLENKERREEFIARLKNSGENSSPVLQVQNAMTELNMHKVPKGIFEKTMLQNMFHYCEPDECFQSFRLVCKAWKNAVESIRFNQRAKPNIFRELDNAITNQTIISTDYFDKYLPAFKKLWIPMNFENNNQIFPLILKNMKKLNKIVFYSLGEVVDLEWNNFIFKMLRNNHNTLSVLDLPTITIPQVTFSNMTHLTLVIGINISPIQFETHFPHVLKHMENLKKVTLNCRKEYKPICQFIAKKYPKHCISGSLLFKDFLNYMPLKIARSILYLDAKVNNKIYSAHLQYAHFYIRNIGKPMNFGWDKYREIFDQCTNLQAIELTYRQGKNFNTNSLENLNEVCQEIWKERFAYFGARGIRLVDENEIWGNENLQIKIAKEAGITWKFEVY